MGRHPTKRNAPTATHQNFVLDILLKGFLSGSQAPVRDEETLATGVTLASWNGRRNVACSCNRDSSGTNVAEPWMDRAWRTVSGALSQQRFPKQSSPKRKLESDAPQEQNVSRRRVRARGKLKEMSPFENHLLLFMLNHFHAKSSGLSEENTRASVCSNCDIGGTVGNVGNDAEVHVSSLGVFLQDHPISSSRLAQELTSGCRKAVRRKQSTLGFARLQGEPQMLGSNCMDREVKSEAFEGDAKQNDTSQEQLRIPYVALPAVSLTGIMELIPQVTGAQQQAFPNKQKLNSVQDFFQYTEIEGRRVFQELDRDKDGQVTLDDLKVAMAKMKLPSFYAQKFLRSTQTHWLAKSFGWEEFSSLIQEKEPMMIRLFNSLSVSKSGTLQRNRVKALLRNNGLPATEGNATAMMKFLGVDTEGSIKYGQFRKFMLLLPTEQLVSDPWTVWFKAATTGPDTSNPAMLESAFNRVNILSSGLAHQIDIVKAMLAAPDVRCVEPISNFIRLGAKSTFYEPLTSGRLGTEIFVASRLLLNNAVTEVSEFQPFSFFGSSIVGPVTQNPCEDKDPKQSNFDGHKHKVDAAASQHHYLEGPNQENAEYR